MWYIAYVRQQGSNWFAQLFNANTDENVTVGLNVSLSYRDLRKELSKYDIVLPIQKELVMTEQVSNIKTYVIPNYEKQLRTFGYSSNVR